MRNKSYVDCFMLMGTALSLRDGATLPEMGRPMIQDFIATVVNLSLIVEEFSIVDVKNVKFEMTGLLDQKWVDPRLGANVRTRKMAVAGQIWKPKITNVNGRSQMDKSDDTVFWRGYGDEGNVLLSDKIKILGRCTVDFERFPFDKQFCQVEFGTYRFPTEEVSLQWDGNSVDLPLTQQTNEFHLINVTKYVKMNVRPSGNFSTAVVQFTIKRNSSHYVICIGAPCLVMILINYMSLWLTGSNIRLNTNLLIFGINMYFYSSSTCWIQPVPYYKALDIFVSLCTSFSVISLVESAVVENVYNFDSKSHSLRKQYRRNVYLFEVGMKIMYPIFYIFFILLYFINYFN